MKKRGRKEKLKKEIFLNIPNSITLIRLLFIFIFIYMLFNDYSKLSLTIVFSIAAISDWFDGYFARKLKQTTKIGARIDQVVDRIFTVSIALSLLFKNLFL
jgi:CDP-diacylglycerol--glycerol-3-phosphate 3-phosphatidyltransferase